MSDIDPQKIYADVNRTYLKRCPNNFMLFLRGLVIPSASGPKLFDTCIAPFQLRDFKLLEPSLRAVRDGRMPPKRRFWIERTKKASKDADLAICLVWLIAFTKRPLLIQVSAANQQQAGIIKRRIKSLLHYNAWLNDYIHIQLNRILSTDGTGEIVIEATGKSGAKQGDTPDVLILNELVHVEKWDVNDTHMNNADGVPQGIVIISTNAGFKGTPPHKWRVNAEQNPKRWTIALWKGKAPWVSDEDVADAQRRDPVGTEFKRLWKGEWQSGTGGAIPEEAIDKAFCVPTRTARPEQGWLYMGGLDLGVSHDHAGVVVLGVNVDEQRIRVARIQGFAPSVPNDHGQLEVDIGKVWNACVKYAKLFNLCWFGYDPAAGGSFIAQRLRKQNVPMREVSFASRKVQDDMATYFVQLLNAGRLECFEDHEGRLRRDFGKFQIVPKIPTGYKLEAVSDEWGHADVGVALVLILPEAVRMIGADVLFTDTDVIFDDISIPTKREQLEREMPGELLDICDAYDDLRKQHNRKKVELVDDGLLFG
jgi:hypothetical protein